MKQLLYLVLVSCVLCQSYPTLKEINLPTTAQGLLAKYSANSAYLATSDTIYVYHIPTETFLYTLYTPNITLMDVSSDGQTIVTVSYGGSYSLNVYNLQGVYVNVGTTAIASTGVYALKISLDKSIIVVGVELGANLYLRNGTGYSYSQSFLTDFPIQGIGLDTTNNVLVISSKRTIYHYTNSSNYSLSQSFPTDSIVVGSTPVGVADVSLNGNLLAFRGDESYMYIRKSTSGNFDPFQNFYLSSSIRKIRASQESYLLAVSLGNNSVSIYANNSASFQSVANFTASSYVTDISLSPDGNYLLIAQNSSSFYLSISATLNQKSMFNNAVAYLLASSIGGTFILVAIYWTLMKKKANIEFEPTSLNQETQTQLNKRNQD